MPKPFWGKSQHSHNFNFAHTVDRWTLSREQLTNTNKSVQHKQQAKHMSEENNNPSMQEVQNPYAGQFGVRNGVKVPWAGKVVVRGANKNTPYITLDFNALDDSAFIKAVGITTLRELVETKMNVAGRAMCSEIIGEDREKAGYTVDQFTAEEFALFQDWADGKVADRTPLADLRKSLSDLVLKGNLEDPEVLMQIMDLRKEINSRQRK